MRRAWGSMIVRDDAQAGPIIYVDTRDPETIIPKASWREYDFSQLNATAVCLTVRGQVHKEGTDYSANPFLLIDICNKTDCTDCVQNLGTGRNAAFKTYAASGNRGERETSSHWFPLNEQGKLFWRWDWTPMDNRSSCAFLVWLDAWA